MSNFLGIPLTDNRTVSQQSYVTVNRRLPERSYLEFHFRDPEAMVTLPFFENVDIRESNRSKLIRYSPIGRSGTLFSYVGSESRHFAVTFNMTLPHIEEYAYQDSLFYKNNRSGANKEDEKNRFLAKSLVTAPGFTSEFIDKRVTPLNENTLTAQLQFEDDVLEDIHSLSTDDQVRRNAVVNIITYWLNVIRGSVTTNSKKPYVGPPIIRLTHGVLYQDVPCVMESYNFDFPTESAGYEIKTMLPRVITVSLILEEIRAGDFGDFERNRVIKRDNLAGYEAIFDPSQGTMDPGKITL